MFHVEHFFGVKMWPFSRNLERAINETKKVRIKGITFRIRKIDPLNYLDGSKAIQKVYDVYEEKKKNEAPIVSDSDIKKAKEHFRDVILAGTISPKLSRKEDESGFWVEKLFLDWELVESLYTQIMTYTYGKKKLVRISQRGG